MPRKYHQKWTHIKPAPAPTSLHLASSSTVGCGSSSSSHNNNNNNNNNNTPTTNVNTLLSHLRSSQSHHHNHDHYDNPTATLPAITRSIPPLLQHLLDTPPPPPPPPRPRITTAPRLPRTPGPPPPASWLTPPSATATPSPTRSAHSLFPHPPLPAPGSLTHFALTAIARDYDFHTTWDKWYLPLLPARLKSLLLLYLHSLHGVRAPVTPAGLLALFPVDEGEEGVTHLSLQCCAPTGLLQVFRPPPLQVGEGGVLGDSWDEAPVVANTRFPALTHLSLASPAADDGKGLLRLLELTPRLTHLSLSGWADRAVLEKLLRGIVKRLLCLKWLEMDAAVAGVLEEEDEEAAWTGAWRGVETVVIVGAEEATAKRFEAAVRAARKREGRGAWFEVLVG
ncbi:hypothetical protein BZA05DRAFT_403898 [Tricharina praecox]|uniref:uncharacterized protein n=1 Tax=Tricharina praecox TaxID=43433 RepID=UPI00221FBE57|nr:uncharacterized protein BZA05DRAFT_403898 [Tricharina praecox]KAI5848377.1 hypothetical protein BZA05DRAFT_403898 [Tricharina praecox]